MADEDAVLGLLFSTVSLDGCVEVRRGWRRREVGTNTEAMAQ